MAYIAAVQQFSTGDVIHVMSAVPESSTTVFMARVYGTDAALLTQADLTSVVLTVRDKADSAVNIGASPYTLTIASVVFDTLQTDALWTEDSTGYNFKYVTLAAQIPDGALTYRFEYVFTTTSSEVIPLIVEVPTVNMFGN